MDSYDFFHMTYLKSGGQPEGSMKVQHVWGSDTINNFPSIKIFVVFPKETTVYLEITYIWNRRQINEINIVDRQTKQD